MPATLGPLLVATSLSGGCVTTTVLWDRDTTEVGSAVFVALLEVDVLCSFEYLTAKVRPVL
jgi:hypothetical protein